MGGISSDMTLGEARSALAWWLEAGVDIAVQEESRDWLKPASAPAKTSFAPNVVPPSQETLAELQQWLASSVSLPLAGPGARRVLPHGPEESRLMLLSDAPTVEDAAAGQPIGGDAWRMMERMLAAIGLTAAEAYSASLSCFSTPGARMSAEDREACAEIARQHIRLARPKRLLVLGEGPSQALLGKGHIAARGHVHKVDGVRTIATFHPRQLINQPSKKSMAWRDLLLLMEDDG